MILALLLAAASASEPVGVRSTSRHTLLTDDFRDHAPSRGYTAPFFPDPVHGVRFVLDVDGRIAAALGGAMPSAPWGAPLSSTHLGEGALSLTERSLDGVLALIPGATPGARGMTLAAGPVQVRLDGVVLLGTAE